MKLYVREDEWYPVFSVRPTEDNERDVIEVDDATQERWSEVFVAFNKVQNEIRDALGKANHVRDLPKSWWSVVQLRPTSRLHYGFYGNEVEAKALETSDTRVAIASQQNTNFFELDYVRKNGKPTHV